MQYNRKGFGNRPVLLLHYILIFFIFLKCVSSNEDVPEPGTYIGCFKERIDLYKAMITAGNVQVCLEMCERVYLRYAVLSVNDKCACSRDLKESERLEEHICNVRCSKNKVDYCGGIDAQSYYDTAVIASGPPSDLKITNLTDTSISIQWEDPQTPDLVTSYNIKAHVLHTFATYPLASQLEWSVQSKDRQFEMPNLHPGTIYNVSVSSMCLKKNCGGLDVIAETIIGVPDPPPEEPKIIKETETTRTVDIPPGINNNGPVTYNRLIVMFIDTEIVQPFDEELLSDYNHSVESGTPYYIAAEFKYQNVTRRFVVGDERTYRGYYNAPLPKDRHVHICLGIISLHKGVTRVRYAITSHEQHSNRGKAFLDMDDSQSSIIALATACVIFGILLISSIFAYCYLRFKTSNRRQRLADTHELTLQGPMIEVENNGFVADEFTKNNFKTQLNAVVDNLDNTQKIPRNSIRLNIDEIIAHGNFGEVLTGTLYANSESFDCQVHVVSDDMQSQDQALFLSDLDQIIRIMPHDKFLHFFGVSASPDWFYVIFEKPIITLKKRLVEARIPPSTDNFRFSAISEECVLQWVYEVAMAMEYLEVNKVGHKKLCSYSVYINQQNQVKVSLFGPIPFGDHGKQIDISRWMAPEVLRFQHHSMNSDVWSYACLAWECCTLGATLYANITNVDLLPRIKNGGRPEQPSFIFNDLYQLFINCWQLEPSERPEFEEIAFNIRQILTSPRHALSFDRHENLFIPYYLPLLEIQN